MRWIRWTRSRRPVDVTTDGAVPLRAERVSGRVTLRNYHCPGLSTTLSRSATQWAIVATAEGLTIDGAGNKIRRIVDGAWTDPGVQALRPAVDDKNRLVITVDAARFNPDRRGEVTITARCADPGAWVELIRAHQR